MKKQDKITEERICEIGVWLGVTALMMALIAPVTPKKTTSEEYDKWNTFLHSEAKYSENKWYLLKNKKGEVWGCSLQEANRLKNDCLDKHKDAKIEPQPADHNYYIVSCWDKNNH